MSRGGWSRVIICSCDCKIFSFFVVAISNESHYSPTFSNLALDRNAVVQSIANVLALMSSLLKRPRSSPTYLTPTRPGKRAPLRLRLLENSPHSRFPVCKPRQLELGSPHHIIHSANASVTAPQRQVYCRQYADAWSEAEIKALVEFVHFHCDKSNWPTHHNNKYWKAAASFVRTQAKTTVQRSGKVRSRCLCWR